MIKVLFLSLALVLSSSALAAAPARTARTEVTHLLDYIEASGCQFYRNGAWYGSKEARLHLEAKYRYLLNGKKISTAEDFIERAASRSTVSGEPYQVRCDRNTPVTTAEWFTGELLRYRAEQRAHKP